MKHIIACRPGCYDLALPEAMAVLKKAGIDNVELNPPDDNDYDGFAGLAADAGMNISSLSAVTNVEDPEQVAVLERIIEGATHIGTRIIFLAASVERATYEEGIEVLKGLAEKARQSRVVLSVETHVPFGQNGDTARRTVETVNSEGLGHNFDTANIYYYNPKGIDTVEELRKVLPHVTSVHLKESAKGEPESFEFPVLGKGIVDFPEVFRLLDNQGFTGPYTLELEGPVVSGLSVEERTEKVKACLAYLRQIGAMD